MYSSENTVRSPARILWRAKMVRQQKAERIRKERIRAERAAKETPEQAEEQAPEQFEPEPMDAEADELQRRRIEKKKGKKVAEPVDDPMDEEKEPEEETSEPGALSKSEIVYNLLREQDFLGTRYPEDATLGALGIGEEVKLLIQNMGLGQMMQMSAGGYRDETCQFLATLKLHDYDEDDLEDFDQGFGGITFRVNGREYSLPYKQLETLYGFPSGEDRETRYKESELKALWKYIAKGQYSPSKSKSSHIRSPVLRYVHKALANTYFARASTGHVTLGELQLLDKGLTPIVKRLGRINMVGEQSNAGLLGPFLDQLMSYQDTTYSHRGRTTKASLHVGGIITPILLACNVPLDERGYVQHRWIDIDYLKRSQFLDHRKVWDNYVYRFDHPNGGLARIFLPNLSYTRLRNGNNADFRPKEDALYVPGMGQDEPQPEHDPMEEDIQEEETKAEPERYFFDDYPHQNSGPDVVAAHKRIGLLQKLSKWHIKKVDQMKETISSMAKSIQKLEKKVMRSARRKPRPLPFMRSRSFNRPIRRQSAQDPPRQSSFEPREEQPQKQKKRRSSSSRRSDFSGGLERVQPDQSEQFGQAPLNFNIRLDHGGDVGGTSYATDSTPFEQTQQPQNQAPPSGTMVEYSHPRSTVPPEFQSAWDDIFGRL